MVPIWSCTSAACEGGVPSAWMTNDAAAITRKTADVRNPGRMHPPGTESTRAYTRIAPAGARRPAKAGRYDGMMYRAGGFRKAKSISARVLLDRHAVVHLVDAEDLRVAAVSAELVVLAHDQRLNRLGRAHFRAQPAETAARQVEIEVVEHLDLGARLAVSAERNQIVRARLRALVADDAGLGAGGGFDLETQHAAKARSRRTTLGRVLESERGLRRVLQRDPHALEQVDQEDRLEETDDGLHDYARSPITRVGSVWPDMITRSLRSTVPSLRILSC